jgi:hypothetical protein
VAPVTVAGLVAFLMTAQPAAAATACGPVADPTGDATAVGPLNAPLPQDPSLDLTSAGAGIADGVLSFSVTVVKLAQAPSHGQVYTVYLGNGGHTYAVVAARYADSSTGFTLRRDVGGSFTTVARNLAGTFDDATSTVRVPLPVKVLAEAVHPGQPLADPVVALQRATSQRLDSPRLPDVLGLPADEVALSCSLDVARTAAGGAGSATGMSKPAATATPTATPTASAPPSSRTVPGRTTASSTTLAATGLPSLPAAAGAVLVLAALGLLRRRGA